jgi:isopentenyl-diphosphate delta-isomerase
MNENDEVLDLVNADNLPIGTIIRKDIAKIDYKHPKGYVRFVGAFLVNTEGKIWVPIRGMHKSIAPGGCDYSVAEHVLAGETNDQAIIRAFAEEANIEANLSSLVFLGSLPPTDEKPVFDEIYALYDYDNGDPDFSKEEFSSGEWLTPDELQTRLITTPSKSSLLPAIHLLLQNLRERAQA